MHSYVDIRIITSVMAARRVLVMIYCGRVHLARGMPLGSTTDVIDAEGCRNCRKALITLSRFQETTVGDETISDSFATRECLIRA
ncbi:hypothetical protein REPUB_Repub13aG0040700 [Reevesia pubescens]